MYPLAPITIGMAIRPGDVLTGTVTWSSPATFTLSLINHTSGASFQQGAIHERAAGAGLRRGHRRVSFVVFRRGRTRRLKRCNFSTCTVGGQPIGGYDWTRIDMINGAGSPVDVTLPLGADGASFR